MSISAFIDISISKKGYDSISSIDILNSFVLHGWSLNNDGKILYLPIGDNDEFDWQENIIDEFELFKIIEQKEKNKEIIGIGLSWKNTSIGGNMLIYPDFSISFSLNINRKKIIDNITDVNWYLEKILPCFNIELATLEKVTFSQYL